MGEVVKNWNNGGSLSVVYTGIGDGNAVISSSKNVGDEREMEVLCVDVSRSVILVRKVVQAAMAEAVETYTRLTYIECTGQQYINTNYVVKEDDIIDMYYITLAPAGEPVKYRRAALIDSEIIHQAVIAFACRARCGS